jgi:hypothetical protein
MTEKKIQEYLHFYFGCRVWIDEKEYGRLVGGDYVPNSVNQIYHNIELDGEKDDDGYPVIIPYNDDFDSPSRVKPILRPLSAMTEEEMLSYARITRPEAEKIVFKDGGISSYYNPGDTTFYKWAKHRLDVFTPEETLWLLSKHFDLFGLIESGLAVDKTKQP